MTKGILLLCLLLAACAMPTSLEQQIQGRWKITHWVDLKTGQDSYHAFPLKTRVHFKNHTLVLRSKYPSGENSMVDDGSKRKSMEKDREEYDWRIQNDSLFVRNDFVAFKIKEISKERLLLELYMPEIFDTTQTRFIHDEITLKRR